jgi:hypothetical protein
MHSDQIVAGLEEGSRHRNSDFLPAMSISLSGQAVGCQSNRSQYCAQSGRQTIYTVWLAERALTAASKTATRISLEISRESIPPALFEKQEQLMLDIRIAVLTPLNKGCHPLVWRASF